LTIQILQYEFLGPIPLEEWGPPMEKLVYIIMSQEKEKFSLIYAGDCEKTEDKAYFVQHEKFKCWAQKAGSEKSMHLAILPLFEKSPDYRKNVLNKIMAAYKPSCNEGEVVEPAPTYTVRKSNPEPQKFSCPCCGTEMVAEEVLEKSTRYRCSSCGISDTKLNS
jgi:hypothetical protein